MTYRGHSVLRTLIRCHFSPAETTGSQYIYSGSADGKIHVIKQILVFFLLDVIYVQQLCRYGRLTGGLSMFLIVPRRYLPPFHLLDENPSHYAVCAYKVACGMLVGILR